MKTLIHKNSTKDNTIHLIPRNEPIDALDWLQVSVDYIKNEFTVRKLTDFYPNFSEWEINPKPVYASGLLGSFITKDIFEQSDKRSDETYLEATEQRLKNYVKFLSQAKQRGDLTNALLLSSPVRLLTRLQEELDIRDNEPLIFKGGLVENFITLYDIVREQAEKDDCIGEKTLLLIHEIQTRLNNQYVQVA